VPVTVDKPRDRHSQPPKSNREVVVLNIATQESWKNDKGDQENQTPSLVEEIFRANGF
jgi:hypothetical protein